jgi:aromatic ring hydroxylase
VCRPSVEYVYLHVVEDTPATVGVFGAQALATGGVLLTALYWYPAHLQREVGGGGDRWKGEREQC